MTKKTFAFAVLLLSFLTSTALLPAHRVSGQSQQPPPKTRQMSRDTVTPAGENRVALVIGNAAYRNARKLDNPANDARAMAKALREVGFDVLGPNGEGYVDLDQRQMIRAVKEFGQRLQANPGVGLFYFAGHGVEANETNYLIPVDADPTDETDLKYQGLDIKDTLDQFIGNRLNIVILDACRDNPFARSFKRTRGGGGDGLKQVEAPTGTLIAYATAPRQTASDGTGVNGLYTEQLLEAIRVKGLTIEQVFKQVRVKVQERSKGTQIPWENSSLNGDFYFIPEGNGSTVAGQPPVADDPSPVVTREKRFGTLVVTASQPGIEIFIDGKSQGTSESRGETFRIDKLVAGRVVEVTGRLKGRDPVVKRVEIEQNREVQIGVEFALAKSFTNAAGLQLVLIPKGSFVMGSEKADEDGWNTFLSQYNQQTNFADERPAHRIHISRDFYMGKYEVTQRQWKYVAEKLPKVNRDLAPSPSFNKGEDLPVEQVNWMDCEEFILRLNQLKDGFEYSLPTEAEWEYACRAGSEGTLINKSEEKPDNDRSVERKKTIQVGNISNFSFILMDYAWFADNSGIKKIDSFAAWSVSDFKMDEFYKKTLNPNKCSTRVVGQKRQNDFGLFDMQGNVWEWCYDWYDKNYFLNSPPENPQGPTYGEQKVLRGGSWLNSAYLCRNSNRHSYPPDYLDKSIGFRVIIRLQS